MPHDEFQRGWYICLSQNINVISISTYKKEYLSTFSIAKNF